MSDLKKERVTFKWSIIETIKGKTFPILVTSYICHTWMNKFCVAWFESKEVFFNSIGLSLVALFCYLPAIVAAILLVWIYQNNKNVNKMMVVGVSLEELERREKRFKWHGLFGLVIGYILWGLVIAIFTPMVSELNFLTMLAIVVGIPVLVIVTYNPINKKMVEKTGTNRELIAEYKSGLYNQLLPEDCMSETDKKGILVCLEKAETHTVRGAIYVHRAKRFLKKIAGVGGVIGLAVAGILLLISFGVVNVFTKAVGEGIDDAVRR